MIYDTTIFGERAKIESKSHPGDPPERLSGWVPEPPHFLPMTLTKIHMQYESQRVNTFREKRVTDRRTDGRPVIIYR